MPPVVPRSLALLALLGLSACHLLIDYEGLTSGDAGAGDAGERCATSRGAAMVDLGSFCVDRTEVTQAQYDVFLRAKNGDTTGQGPECAGNSAYEPAGDCTYDPVGQATHPVDCVDWCDAKAYCAFAGKRLCGARGGGALPYLEFSSPSRSEWMFACTQGVFAFPYGNTYQPTACNTAGVDAGGTVPVGTFAGCQTDAGLFDLSGNVREWEDACDGTSGMAMCRVRGGGYTDVAVDARCDADQPTPRTAAWTRRGIRCCKDP